MLTDTQWAEFEPLIEACRPKGKTLSGGICRSMPRFPPRRRRRMVELIRLEIVAVPAEQSRGRHNPRVVKRKMSSFPTKARAVASSRPVFRSEEHIRIVAPVGMPEFRAPPAALRQQRSKRDRTSPPHRPAAPHPGWSKYSPGELAAGPASLTAKTTV